MHTVVKSVRTFPCFAYMATISPLALAVDFNALYIIKREHDICTADIFPIRFYEIKMVAVSGRSHCVHLLCVQIEHLHFVNYHQI